MILSFRLASSGFIFAIALGVATPPALAVECGDTVTNSTVLNSDLICTCVNDLSVLIVEGPAALDLNGHTVSCSNSDHQGTYCLRIRGNGATIKNGVVSSCHIGVGGFKEINGTLIKDTNATDNTGYGFFINGDNNRLIQATARDNFDVGIWFEGNNNQVRDSYVTGSLKATGFFQWGVNNKVISNTIEDVGYNCIEMYNGVGNVIWNNTVRRCGGHGAVVDANSYSLVDNKFYSTGRASIYANGWGINDRNTATRITGNQIINSSGDGIVVAYEDKAVVASNVIVNSAGNGIVLHSPNSRCRVRSNTIRKCGMAGLRVRGADGNNVTANKISFCTRGINVGLGSNHNRLINNRASNNTLFDLSDLSANCGSNVWKGNDGKGNIPCTQKK